VTGPFIRIEYLCDIFGSYEQTGVRDDKLADNNTCMVEEMAFIQESHQRQQPGGKEVEFSSLGYTSITWHGFWPLLSEKSS
jgi:hypothetical protein